MAKFTPRSLGLLPWMLFHVQLSAPRRNPADPLCALVDMEIRPRKWVLIFPFLAYPFLWLMTRKGARRA